MIRGDLVIVKNTVDQWAPVVPDGTVGVISAIPGFLIGPNYFQVVDILCTDGELRPIGYGEDDVELL